MAQTKTWTGLQAVTRVGLWRRLALAVLIAANVWLATAIHVPLQSPGTIVHLLVFRSVAALGVALLFALIVSVAIPIHRCHPAYLLLLAFPFLGLGLAATPWRPYATPFLFLGVDMQLWLLAAILSLAVADWWTGRHAGSTPAAARFPVGPARRSTEVILVGALAVAALWSSPPLRFQSAVLGDEPKYLRFDENWYRGQGLDIANFPDIRDLDPSFRPRLGENLSRAFSALRTVGQDLVHDAGSRWRADPTTRPPVVGGNWFIPGRHGGVYQVHNPGFSALLLPGYVIDRWLNTTAEFHPQFPSNLYATNLTVLLLYLLWAAALFRLLARYTGEPVISAAVCGVVMLSLPATAFNYQYYPEVAGGLFFTIAFRFVVIDKVPSRRAVLIGGVIAGLLPWLHIRYGLLTLVLAAAASIRYRRQRRELLLFWIGAAVPLIALTLYTYYLAGSVFPWVLYTLVPDSPGFNVARAIRETWWFWIDRAWGLLPHAPVFLLALPGIRLMWRRDREVLISIGAAIGGLAFLSAAHGLSGGATTPLRLIAAVVPLLALPLVAATVSFRRSPAFLALFGVLAACSIQNGLAYNRFLIKHDAALAGPTVSGWKTTLAFPSLESGGSGAVLLAGVWIAVTLAIVAWPRPSQSRAQRLSVIVVARAAVLALAGVAGFASVLAWATGVPFGPRYFPEPAAVRDRIVRSHLARRGAIPWSPERGTIDIPTTFPSPPDASFEMKPNVASGAIGSEILVKAVSVDARGELAWGMATIDYGDGSALERMPFVGAEYVRHRYGREGDFVLTAYLVNEPSARIVQTQARIHVGP